MYDSNWAFSGVVSMRPWRAGASLIWTSLPLDSTDLESPSASLFASLAAVGVSKGTVVSGLCSTAGTGLSVGPTGDELAGFINAGLIAVANLKYEAMEE